jgi:hypothetical protein
MDGMVRTLEREAAVAVAGEESGGDLRERLALAKIRAGALVAVIRTRKREDSNAKRVSVTKRAANGNTWKSQQKRAARLYLFFKGGDSPKARRLAMRLALADLGLASAEPKSLPLGLVATWARDAGCSCGCSPGFVLSGPLADELRGWDLFADVLSAEPEELS